MAQQVRKRFQKTVKYQPNNKETENLSRGMVYRELRVRLRGQLTLAGVDNTAANTKKGSEFGLIKSLQVVANNTDVVRSIKGVDLWWLNYLMLNSTPVFSREIGDGSTVNPSFDSYLILPIWMPRSLRPMDTALDARQLSDLKVDVQWADHTAVNDAATGFEITPTLEVSSLESFGVSGPFSQWRTYPIEKAITQDNNQFQIEIPVNYMYRGFFLNFTSAGADDGSILNNFKWKSGTTVFADLTGRELHEEYLARNNINSQVDILPGAANDLAGQYMYDHVTDGYLTESVDALGFSELTLELDVTAGTASKVTVYPMQIIPVRGGKNNQ